ncbi:MAG: hypothetical protein QXI11_06185 [Thermoproteota archaeon]
MELAFMNLLGLIVFFIFCGLALKYIDDVRIKVIAFLSALIISAILAGLIKFENLGTFIQRINQKADTISVGLSGMIICIGMLLPRPLRRPLVFAGLSGLILGLIGIPVWIIWILILILAFIIFYLIYRMVIKILGKNVKCGLWE